MADECENSNLPKRRKGRWVKLFLRLFLSLLVVLVVLFFSFGSSVMDLADRARSSFEQRLSDKLKNENGIIFLASFDEFIPVDMISHEELLLWDSPRVEGKYGCARRLKSDSKNAVLQASYQTVSQPKEVTFSSWIRPNREIKARQDLFFTVGDKCRFNLSLEGNELEILLTDHDGRYLSRATCEASFSDQFEHIAVAISGKCAKLYFQGRLAGTVEHPSSEIDIRLLPMSFNSKNHSPYYGDIDDYVLFSRALSDSEILKISQSSKSVLYQSQPLLASLTDYLSSASGSLTYLYRIFDRVLPSATTSALLNTDIPTMSLWMSVNDERHFKNAHEKSLKNGYRTDKAATFRRVYLSLHKKRYPIEISMDDCYDNRMFRSKRPAFIIRDTECGLFGESGLARLYPPELYSLFHPEAPYPLPHNSTIVKLNIDDSFKGIYVLEPFEMIGSAYLSQGKHDREDALYYSSMSTLASSLLPGVDNDKLFERNVSLFNSDIFFPWSRIEINYRRKRLARFHSRYNFSKYRPEIIHPAQILGENPALLYVTNNLSLPNSTGSGEGIIWRSSDTRFVSDSGVVTRPEGNEFEFVTLTASTASASQEFRLRVIPKTPNLMTVFINVGLPVVKHKRRDFSAVMISSDGSVTALNGTGDTKGGIRHRGNTSYAKAAKRSLSLEFDEAVIWQGLTNSVNHILIYSGYADPTRLRNKVSYDTYRMLAMSNNSSTPSVIPSISFIEYFINGEYFGVAESGHRLRDMVPDDTLVYKVRARSNLWLNKRTYMTEVLEREISDPEPYRPMKDFFVYTSGSSREDFSSTATERFYMDNLIDYYIMLNFTQNADAMVNNQYLAITKRDYRLFLIPWDYDKTFFPNEKRILSNHLFARLLNEVPGFRNDVNERWRTLRKSVLSESELFKRIDFDAENLRPYMNEEYRIVKPLGEDGDFAHAVQKLKSSISNRLKVLDTALRRGASQ